VDFHLDADQRAILDAVDTINARHAGAGRIRELGGDEPSYDHDLHKHLREAGFLDLALDERPLDAALVAQAVARQLGVVAAAYHALVLPSLGLDVEGPIAIVAAESPGPARFAADAEVVVTVDGGCVRAARPKPGSVARVGSRLGWPVGDATGVDQGEALPDAHPDEVRARWRVALALELVGSMSGALDLTVAHVTDRHQFGRPIGSFQAVQHGLAKCAVAIEGARWLAYEAAWSGEWIAAATALSAAVRAAERVRRDTHQFTGALGFTTEYDLHLWTMRLPALTIEAETIGSASVAAATSRWPASR
jgi:alkylation response protein AidB-like acyl-CoA dehydrogenase